MEEGGGGGEPVAAPAPAPPPRKKKPKKRKQQDNNKSDDGDGGGKTAGGRKKARKQARRTSDSAAAMSAAQQSVNEQMRRVLEEDQYSAMGSIVDTDSDEEDAYMYRGQSIRLDRTYLQQAARKFALLETKRKTQKSAAAGIDGAVAGSAAGGGADDDHDDDDDLEDISDDLNAASKDDGKGKAKEAGSASNAAAGGGAQDGSGAGAAAAAPYNKSGKDEAFHDPLGLTRLDEDDLDRDGGSIFGQTTGSSANSTWVECDKCKKWRRLRGVVDEKKLPTKWYCSMNKNDPDRARCSAPEEEYEATHTPESAADARTRKHLRVWVRRLQCQEAYEGRQPTLTRGKKRAAASSSKEPYEWVRCCNPSCGKWRALLRIMDAKTNVLERIKDGEWYCVQNTWDEKQASCAAPQENLPAVGCPPWVLQDE